MRAFLTRRSEVNHQLTVCPDVSDTTAFRDVVSHRGYGGFSFFPRGKESAKKQSERSNPQ